MKITLDEGGMPWACMIPHRFGHFVFVWILVVVVVVDRMDDAQVEQQPIEDADQLVVASHSVAGSPSVRFFAFIASGRRAKHFLLFHRRLFNQIIRNVVQHRIATGTGKQLWCGGSCGG